MQAAEHESGVWILRRAPDGDFYSDLRELQRARTVMLVELPNKSMVLHKDNCSEEEQWDTYPAPFKTQLWFIPGQLASQHRVTSCAATFRQTLLRWERPQYDFYWHDSPVPLALELHSKHQQEALRHRWTGLRLVAGTDGSVDEPSGSLYSSCPTESQCRPAESAVRVSSLRL